MPSQSSAAETGTEAMTGASPSLLLPANAVLLHIGPRKTGTSAVQNAMRDARGAMRSHGVLYPGKGARPVNPGRAVLGMRSMIGFPPPRMEDWHRYIAEVAAAGDQRVCVSSEDFAAADTETARRVVQDLGAERVHVVLVARRLDKLIPSEWQERVKARQTMSYEEWLEDVLRDATDERPPSRFWIQHDLGALIDRWSQAAGPERVSVVVLDPSEPNQLSRTFEQMLGLPDGLIQEHLAPVNSSLTWGRAEIIRQVNRAFIENGWPDDQFRSFHRAGLRRMLVHAPRRAQEEPVPVLPHWAAERVQELSHQRVTDLESAGVRLLGADPRELLPVTPSGPDDRGEPTGTQTGDAMVPAEVAALAVEGVIVGARRREEQRTKQHRRELREMERQVERAREQVSVLEQQVAGSPRLDRVPGSQLVDEMRRRAVRKVARRVRRRGAKGRTSGR